MPTTRVRQPHAIKDKIDHPVIDADAHWLEPLPVLLDYIDKVAGPGAVDRLRGGLEGRGSQNNLAGANSWYDATEQERLAKRMLRGGSGPSQPSRSTTPRRPCPTYSTSV